MNGVSPAWQLGNRPVAVTLTAVAVALPIAFTSVATTPSLRFASFGAVCGLVGIVAVILKPHLIIYVTIPLVAITPLVRGIVGADVGLLTVRVTTLVWLGVLGGLAVALTRMGKNIRVNGPILLLSFAAAWGACFWIVDGAMMVFARDFAFLDHI